VGATGIRGAEVNGAREAVVAVLFFLVRGHGLEEAVTVLAALVLVALVRPLALAVIVLGAQSARVNLRLARVLERVPCVPDRLNGGVNSLDADLGQFDFFNNVGFFNLLDWLRAPAPRPAPATKGHRQPHERYQTLARDSESASSSHVIPPKAHQARPDTYPQTFYPKTEVDCTWCLDQALPGTTGGMAS